MVVVVVNFCPNRSETWGRLTKLELQRSVFDWLTKLEKNQRNELLTKTGELTKRHSRACDLKPVLNWANVSSRT